MERTTLGISMVALIIALIALSTVAFTMNVLPQQVLGEEEEPNLLTTSGTGKVEARPDLATISITVQTQAGSASEALQRQAERMNAVIEALRGLGIGEESIKTTEISLYPIYSDKEPYTVVAYRASNTILLTLSTEDESLLGNAIDTAVKAGANRIGIAFTFSNELYNILKRQAISKAVQDAKEKAEAALSPLNLGILGVKNINIESYYPIPYIKGAAMEAEAVRTPVVVGTSEISANVQISFIIG